MDTFFLLSSFEILGNLTRAKIKVANGNEKMAVVRLVTEGICPSYSFPKKKTYR